jgi:hypothetical protein
MQNKEMEDNEMPNFEVESIELTNPKLFSDDDTINTTSQNIEHNEHGTPEIFENLNKQEESEEVKEPEMFDDTNKEEDFEIPAFLRRQKN